VSNVHIQMQNLAHQVPSIVRIAKGGERDLNCQVNDKYVIEGQRLLNRVIEKEFAFRNDATAFD
jgi:hypothetical protein